MAPRSITGQTEGHEEQENENRSNARVQPSGYHSISCRMEADEVSNAADGCTKGPFLTMGSSATGSPLILRIGATSELNFEKSGPCH